MSVSLPPPDRPDLNLSKLRAAISEQRFARYLTEAGGDERLAWELYEWGLDVASALHPPLHAVEITLRNRIFESIARLHGRAWLTHPSRAMWLRASEIAMIENAHRQVSRERRTVNPDDLVAALPFGFWVGLVAGFHDQGLWRETTYGRSAANSNDAISTVTSTGCAPFATESRTTNICSTENSMRISTASTRS